MTGARPATAPGVPAPGSDPGDPPVESLFDGVVGQPAAVAALRAAARSPVHAYLFFGAPGSGRRAAARAFAAALLCPRGGCGDCDACRQALAGTHPDLVVLERTGAALGVDDLRRLVGLAQRTPFLADRQVLVVADVHLAARVAPALLKTVEEPPPPTVFVLLAEDVPPELVTVASRCVEVAFPPLPDAVVRSWLVSRGVPEPQAELVAEGAGGNLDRARLLAEDEGFAARLALWRSVPARLDGQGATAGALARELLGSAEEGLGPLRARHAAELAEAAEAAEAVGDRGVPGRRELAERQRREERRWRTDEIRAGLGIVARAYRDRLVDALSPPGGTPAAGAPANAAQGYERAVDLVTSAAAALRRNPNETLLLEALLVRLDGLAG